MTDNIRVEMCKLKQFASTLNIMDADGYALHSWNTFTRLADVDPRITVTERMVVAVFTPKSGQAERGQ